MRALTHQTSTDPLPSHVRFDQQHPQLRRLNLSGVASQKHRADDFARLLGDPATLVVRIVAANEIGSDLGHECLETLIRSVLLAVKDPVAMNYPADIARMAMFLAADDSKMITGQQFLVDGGWANI